MSEIAEVTGRSREFHMVVYHRYVPEDATGNDEDT